MSGSSNAGSAKEQILQFRVMELQEACQRLGLSKTGKKATLQARLLAYLGEADPLADRSSVRPPVQQWRVEAAVRVIRDIFCHMRGLPNTHSDQSTGDQFVVRGGGVAAQQAQHTAVGSNAHPPPLPGGNPPAHPGGGGAGGVPFPGVGGLAVLGKAPPTSSRHGMTVRCICSVQTERGQMIQCQDPGCGVWQHCDCLRLGEGGRPLPPSFCCETCRARLADPFWDPLEPHILPPSRLKAQPGRPGLLTSRGMQEVQVAERVFFLTPAHMEMVQRDPSGCRIQVACLEVHDEVQLRYHWPRHVGMTVNNMQYRPYSRSVNQKMGVNQRDEPASIGSLCVRGRNTLSVTTAEGGIWVLLLQLARKRTINQVKAHMAPPESLPAAVERVGRLVSGGGDDDDDDDGILVSHQVVSLKDPMSNQRIKVPARFRDASGLQCFDLDTFLGMVERNRKWQDPTTMRNSSLPQLQIDTYTLCVLQCLETAPHVSDVELSADGKWRPAGVEGPWVSIHQDPATISILPSVPVKAEPSVMGSGVVSPGAGRAKAEVLSSEEESEDEEAELRAAAQALLGQKRKEPEPAQRRRESEVEVIDLLDSSDDDAPQPLRALGLSSGGGTAGTAAAAAPPPASPAATQQQQQQQQQSNPLRIRLPIRIPRNGSVAGAASTQRQPLPQQHQQSTKPAGSGVQVRSQPSAQASPLQLHVPSDRLQQVSPGALPRTTLAAPSHPGLLGSGLSSGGAVLSPRHLGSSGAFDANALNMALLGSSGGLSSLYGHMGVLGAGGGSPQQVQLGGGVNTAVQPPPLSLQVPYMMPPGMMNIHPLIGSVGLGDMPGLLRAGASGPSPTGFVPASLVLAQQQQRPPHQPGSTMSQGTAPGTMPSVAQHTTHATSLLPLGPHPPQHLASPALAQQHAVGVVQHPHTMQNANSPVVVPNGDASRLPGREGSSAALTKNGDQGCTSAGEPLGSEDALAACMQLLDREQAEFDVNDYLND